MKIIFSRKGFDSSAGGFPSPIFPDGTLFPIPIPDKRTSVSYSDLTFSYKGDSIQKILNDLTGKKIFSGKKRYCDYKSVKFKCHLDPMIVEKFHLMAFGQEGKAASHLLNQRVGKGDIFLFFGWFREVVKKNGKWRYDKDSLDLHVIWGFMEVEEIIVLNKENVKSIIAKYPFLENHPHVEVKRKHPNILFLSKKNGKKFKLQEKLVLTDTKNYKGRSFWRLPRCFNQSQAFSYLKSEKFVIDRSDVVVETPGRGQEFVLSLEKIGKADREEILNFVKNLIK